MEACQQCDRGEAMRTVNLLLCGMLTASGEQLAMHA